MGTITGVNDLDGVRWKNSQWRNIQVCIIEHIPQVYTYIFCNRFVPGVGGMGRVK